MAHEVHYRGSREDVRKMILSFIASMSSDGGDYMPYVRGIKLRVGMVALACIQEAFIDKAKGESSEDGITWNPLTKQTVANRALGPGDRGLMKGYGAHNGRDIKGRIKRGFLTPAEDKRWRMIFATRRNWLIAKHGMSEEAASGRAAQIAWATLKAEGAKTKLDVLGNRHVEIGRDTGRLFASLSPGVETHIDAAKHKLLDAVPPILHPSDKTEPTDRVLREDPGAVIVGSNVKYAGRFHAQRPLWPESFPAVWLERIAEATQSGIAEAIARIVGGASGRRAG